MTDEKDMIPVTFRLPPEIVKRIDGLVKEKRAKSKSDYIRTAVMWRLGVIARDEREWSEILKENLRKNSVRDMFKEIIEEIILEHGLV
ncbi:MAG: ribbon-helix-helix domain-containing protein [Candidatus Kariarchaeaceae archaeon]